MHNVGFRYPDNVFHEPHFMNRSVKTHVIFFLRNCNTHTVKKAYLRNRDASIAYEGRTYYVAVRGARAGCPLFLSSLRFERSLPTVGVLTPSGGPNPLSSQTRKRSPNGKLLRSCGSRGADKSAILTQGFESYPHHTRKGPSFESPFAVRGALLTQLFEQGVRILPSSHAKRALFREPFAVRGGFEPPVRIPIGMNQP